MGTNIADASLAQTSAGASEKPAEATGITPADAGEPRCLKYAKRGLNTNVDFTNFMSSMISDVVEGKITPQVTNAACNAGGKLMKMIELTYKYGVAGKRPEERSLKLTVESDIGEVG
jgi:hypothetical protein